MLSKLSLLVFSLLFQPVLSFLFYFYLIIFFLFLPPELDLELFLLKNPKSHSIKGPLERADRVASPCVTQDTWR